MIAKMQKNEQRQLNKDCEEKRHVNQSVKMTR